ncbi:uncharacterized protein [Euwallacea similis]|uniref:uncharacterized protein n=1 Tax=Euwallacea similis TaxID=1736056 RepID=UPI00344E4149
MINYEDDTHFCLKCHATILGLENYIGHRKTDCGKVTDEQEPVQESEEIDLKADDFFSSLELRSSSKKPEQSTSGKNFSGILTRSKFNAVYLGSSKEPQEPQQSKSGKNVWIGGNQLKDLGTGDNQSKLIKAVANLERRKEGTTSHSPPRIGTVYDESDEDSEEYEYEEDESSEEDYAHPRNFTGGKWKPSSPVQWGGRDWNIPPPNYTGGKWKPKRAPSPSYTKGKWKPPEDELTGGKFPPPGHTKGKWRPADYDSHPTSGGKYPPPGHTRGKWKPYEDENHFGGKYPPIGHTKGKWKPIEDDAYPTSGGKLWTSGHGKGKSKPPEDDAQPSSGCKYSPPGHAKGKWKTSEDDIHLASGGKYPPPGHSRGKWRPVDEEASTSGGKYPSPDHTEDKWRPGDEEIQTACGSKHHPAGLGKGKSKSIQKNEDTIKTESLSYLQPRPNTESDTSRPIENINSEDATRCKTLYESPLRKSGGTVQYWCGPCNRQLASKIVYERHLKSELHFKRSRRDGEFDEGVTVKRIKVEPQQSPTVVKPLPVQAKKRGRRKIFETCAVCKCKVNRYLMGKHLISHYHCRKGDISSEESKKLVLDNILNIVLESPFQCNVCKFFCNAQEQFIDHWKTDFHQRNDQNHRGYYFCAFCKQRSETTEDMLKHLKSFAHLEVVSVINRSVPIIIKKISDIHCLTCNSAFALNIQLLNHCKKSGHDSSNVSLYNSEDYKCKNCDKSFSKAMSLQRHLRKKHQYGYFFCGPCGLTFETSADASSHRRTMEHRYVWLEKKIVKRGKLRRMCEYCDEVFPNFLLLKEHLKSQHPDHKIRCPYCGENFTISQELTNHMRSKSCKFPNIVSSDGAENTYQCLQCPFSSDSTAELLFHVALHGEALEEYKKNTENNGKPNKLVPKYKCPICDKFFPKYSLQSHLRIHTEERPYVCKTCNATFARKNNLLYHEKNHEVKRKIKRKESKDGKSFLCSTCGAGFNRKFTLQQHMLTHGGKLCRCPEVGCFFIARKMSELQQHVTVHSPQKNFGCDLCEYKGKTKNQLRQHKVIHDAVKRYSCNVCPFTCRTCAHLRRHMRLHTGARPFKCPYCNYKCNNMENLRRHVLSTTKHPGKSVYECKLCSKFQTNIAKEFKNHLMLSHNEEFGHSKVAATYISGIYQSHEDSTYLVDAENEDAPPDASEEKVKVMEMKSNEDPVVTQLAQPTDLGNKDGTLDQMLPMFIISKDDSVNVEIASDSWSLIGRYDVEESGTLVPFHSEEDDELFQEHF